MSWLKQAPKRRHTIWQQDLEKAPYVEREDLKMTKYTPEWAELNKLIEALAQEGVPGEAMDQVISDNSFDTVGDVNALKVKLWNLATETYKIPREVLIQKMEKGRK